MKKNKGGYLVTGYQVFGTKDPERITWYFSTIEAAREAVNRPSYDLTRCDIWHLVETISPVKKDHSIED